MNAEFQIPPEIDNSLKEISMREQALLDIPLLSEWIEKACNNPNIIPSENIKKELILFKKRHTVEEVKKQLKNELENIYNFYNLDNLRKIYIDNHHKEIYIFGEYHDDGINHYLLSNFYSKENIGIMDEAVKSANKGLEATYDDRHPLRWAQKYYNPYTGQQDNKRRSFRQSQYILNSLKGSSELSYLLRTIVSSMDSSYLGEGYKCIEDKAMISNIIKPDNEKQAMICGRVMRKT